MKNNRALPAGSAPVLFKQLSDPALPIDHNAATPFPGTTVPVKVPS